MRLAGRSVASAQGPHLHHLHRKAWTIPKQLLWKPFGAQEKSVSADPTLESGSTDRGAVANHRLTVSIEAALVH
jgi:hypothetical protein